MNRIAFFLLITQMLMGASAGHAQKLTVSQASEKEFVLSFYRAYVYWAILSTKSGGGEKASEIAKSECTKQFFDRVTTDPDLDADPFFCWQDFHKLGWATLTVKEIVHKKQKSYLVCAYDAYEGQQTCGAIFRLVKIAGKFKIDDIDCDPDFGKTYLR